MDFIISIWDGITNFFDFIVFYVTHFFDFFDDGIRLLMKYLTKLWFWLSLQAMQAAYELAQELLAGFDISGPMDAAWSSIPSQIRGLLVYFRIPEIVNMGITAVTTKAVLRFNPMF